VAGNGREQTQAITVVVVLLHPQPFGDLPHPADDTRSGSTAARLPRDTGRGPGWARQACVEVTRGPSDNAKEMAAIASVAAFEPIALQPALGQAATMAATLMTTQPDPRVSQLPRDTPRSSPEVRPSFGLVFEVVDDRG
jgi:hypothetical protein